MPNVVSARAQRRAGPVLAAPRENPKCAARDWAGWWRGFSAFGIDAVDVIAIVISFGASVAPLSRQSETDTIAPGDVSLSAPGVGAITNPKENARAPRPRPPLVSFVAPAQTAAPKLESHWENPLQIEVGGNDVPLSIDAIGTLVSQAIRHLGFAFWFRSISRA